MPKVTNDVMLNIARCWASQRGKNASAKPILPTLSMETRQLLNKLLNDRAFLEHFLREGIILKGELEMHHLKPNLEIIPVRGLAIFTLRHEDLQSGRRVPIRKLQRQAWEYLKDKAAYLLVQLSDKNDGSIARGIFSGQRAFEELMAATSAKAPDEKSAKAPNGMSASEAFISQYIIGSFQNNLMDEIKTHAAVALTCFGGKEVLETLKSLSREREGYAVELNSVTRHLLLALMRFSALSFGVMYSANVPEEYLENVTLLRRSGAALDIIAEIDRFHDDPKNSKYFIEVPTNLRTDAEEMLFNIAKPRIKA